MRREQLELSIDMLFSERIRNSDFLSGIAETHLARSKALEDQSCAPAVDDQIKRLEQKLKRLSKLYERGLISDEELDVKVAEAQAAIAFCQSQLTAPKLPQPTIDFGTLNWPSSAV